MVIRSNFFTLTLVVILAVAIVRSENEDHTVVDTAQEGEFSLAQTEVVSTTRRRRENSNAKDLCYVYSTKPFDNMTYRDCVNNPPNGTTICSDFDQNVDTTGANECFRPPCMWKPQNSHMRNRYTDHCFVCPSTHPWPVKIYRDGGKYDCQSTSDVKTNGPYMHCDPNPPKDNEPTSCVKTGISSQNLVSIAVQDGSDNYKFVHNIDCMVVKQSFCKNATANSTRSCSNTKQVYFDKLVLDQVNIPDSHGGHRRRRSSGYGRTMANINTGPPAEMNVTYATTNNALKAKLSVDFGGQTAFPVAVQNKYVEAWQQMVTLDAEFGLCSSIAQIA